MLGIPNVLVYIDDLLIHSKTHEEHLEILEQVFSRLRAHGLKMNLPKCFFGSKNVSYLGFRLTEEGIVPGKDKLKAVEKAQPPTSVHEIRQFLGLCNFFRTHVKNFAQVASPQRKNAFGRKAHSQKKLSKLSENSKVHWYQNQWWTTPGRTDPTSSSQMQP